ncbi:MAG: sigma-54-dependent Fis family transcriptional regulator [bacterium]|nr:sigma-54-dependent Fis family transcriptional regulator [bacterium]
MKMLSTETLHQQIALLLERNDKVEIERFLKNPPLEIEEDELLHQKIVVLHDRIGSVDPLVSAHVYWQRNKGRAVLDHREVGKLSFMVSASSVLDHSDASYIVAATDATLDPSNFSKAGLMQHIQWLEGSEFFSGAHRPPRPLDFLDVWEIASTKRQFRYLFVNLEQNARRDYACSLDDILHALTTCLNHVARHPQAKIVAIPTLGWRDLNHEDKEASSREILNLIENFCKDGQTGNLEEVRLSLYSLEAAFTFSKTLNETKQKHIEHLNERLADARILASGRTDLIYEFHSPAFKAIRERIDAQLDANHPIVFIGEPGVGKQFFGAYVHSHGPRRNQPFILAGQRDSMENDPWKSLAGGRSSDNDGGKSRCADRVMTANNGTLFVKHLDHMPSDVQEFMVHFLDRGTYYPNGADKPKTLDVRVLFASQEPLASLVEKKSLIPDLYHRLQPYTIELPPLRKRQDDILPIASMWLDIYRDEHGYAVTGFDEEVVSLFQAFDWPNNVSQLQSIIQMAVQNTKEGVITMKHVSLLLPHADEVPSLFAKKTGLLTDYLELRRKHLADWETFNQSISNEAFEVIKQLLNQPKPGTLSVASLLAKLASEFGWPKVHRILVARRVIVGMFKLRKHKWPSSSMSTVKLLGYVEELDDDQPKTAKPTRGALAKYLSELGLTMSNVQRSDTDGLFPEEIQMLLAVTRLRLSKSK